MAITTSGRLATTADRATANLLRVPLFEMPDHYPGSYGQSQVEKEIAVDDAGDLADRLYGTPWTVAALVRSGCGLSAFLACGSPRRKAYHPDTGHYTERGINVKDVANSVRDRLAKRAIYYWWLAGGYNPSGEGSYPWL
jgi:hypothetical protein